MPNVRKTTFAPFTAGQMYALVNDIEAYPSFLPWCVDAQILERGQESMKARVGVSKGRFDYAFTTSNQLIPERSIVLSLVDGPFRKLSGRWDFLPEEQGCTVRFEIDFEFSSRMLGRALSVAFRPIMDSLVDAFRKRAYVVYA
ncbi:MAG: type II toxin-antitoxin system RatA family toxin [Gammaproteobacteria bacterium]|jgi:ribosome-associated toxin RatA of RatAB toxin-antitoxin module